METSELIFEIKRRASGKGLQKQKILVQIQKIRGQIQKIRDQIQKIRGQIQSRSCLESALRSEACSDKQWLGQFGHFISVRLR
jgi:hypothetical protein